LIVKDTAIIMIFQSTLKKAVNHRAHRDHRLKSRGGAGVPHFFVRHSREGGDPGFKRFRMDPRLHEGDGFLRKLILR
jgi:hypothetical protein